MLGRVEVYRGAQLVIDTATGTVTDASKQPVTSATPTATATPSPASGTGYGLFSRLYVGIAGGYSTTVPSLSFCQDNAAKLGQLGARQNACGLNGTNGFYGVSAGLTFARLFGADLVAAGGWADFGRTQPLADGSTATVTIVRRAEEHFRGGWAGGGLQRTWSTWNLQGTLAVTYIARETSTTDTFTRLSDGQSSASTTSRRDTDVQPMVSLELFRRTGPFFIGTGYRYTRVEDAVKTQGLHGVYGTIRVLEDPHSAVPTREDLTGRGALPCRPCS